MSERLLERLSVTRLPARAGFAWLAESFGWMRQMPMLWLGLGAAALLALLLLNLIPAVGGLLSMLLTPFWVAGFMAASRDASQGRPVTVLHLRAGFDAAAPALFVIAAINLAGTLLISQWLLGDVAESLMPMMAAMHDGGHMSTALSPTDAERMAQHAEAALPSLLLALLLMLPLLMATWFAPALVLFHGFPPLRALWWSLWAVWVNPAACLSYGLLLTTIWLLALLLPLGIGLMLAFPWAMASTYAAYQAIFRLRAEVPANTAAPAQENAP